MHHPLLITIQGLLGWEGLGNSKFNVGLCSPVPHFKTLPVGSECCRFSSGGGVLSRIWKQKLLMSSPKVLLSVFQLKGALPVHRDWFQALGHSLRKSAAHPVKDLPKMTPSWGNFQSRPEIQFGFSSWFVLSATRISWGCQRAPAQFAPSFPSRASSNPNKLWAAPSGPAHQIFDDVWDFFLTWLPESL